MYKETARLMFTVALQGHFLFTLTGSPSQQLAEDGEVAGERV